jgi:hypothetical protein
MMGLYEMMDEAMAQELGVDIETYCDVIENKCSYEEADLIITNIFSETNIEEAKQLFFSKINKEI